MTTPKGYYKLKSAGAINYGFPIANFAAAMPKPPGMGSIPFPSLGSVLMGMQIPPMGFPSLN